MVWGATWASGLLNILPADDSKIQSLRTTSLELKEKVEMKSAFGSCLEGIRKEEEKIDKPYYVAG